MGNSAAEKTAGIIIIGNEILSGKVQDSNSFFLASELRALGVNVLRITVIPDDIEVIGREAVLFSKSFDHVFTSGGVGPTHDDLTMKGLADGFGVAMMLHPSLEARFRRRYGDRLNEAILKMALVPEGTEVIDFGDNSFPLIFFRNIYVFPGIPRFLREKFLLVRERFRTVCFFLARIFVNAEESEIAALLNRTVAAYPEISFGSYPIMDNPEYRIIITAEARDKERLDAAVARLLTLLPEQIIVRVE
ncbi:MAG: competence/damage-inducible protein A [Nitrospiraceae bacterium]|nr:competence/damage-inducible protein A [Nitrospiraceae bacterium]